MDWTCFGGVFSLRQVDILATERKIPRTKLGRKTVFQRKHLDSFLDRHTNMSRDDIERSVATL